MEQQALRGEAVISAEQVREDVARLTVRISNTTPLPPAFRGDRESAMLHSLVSPHTVLRVSAGAFISQTDPPAELAEAAAACENIGTWPVLVGPPGSSDTVLSSPIILEDHPRIAAESPADFFDATEIDELLTLRILTLTDEEKEEMRTADARTRQLLERTEALSQDEMMRLHGAVRSLRPWEQETTP